MIKSRRIPTLLMGFLAVASVTAYFAGTHYIVLTDVTTTTLRKPSFAILPVAIDIRGWSAADMLAHPEIARLFISQGKGRLLPGGELAYSILEGGRSAIQTIDRAASAAIDAVRGAPERLAERFARGVREDVMRDAQPVLEALVAYALQNECVFPTIRSVEEAKSMLVPRHLRKWPAGIRIVSGPRSFSIRGVEGTVAAEMEESFYPQWNKMHSCP